LVLIALTLVGVLYPIIKTMMKSKQEGKHQHFAPATASLRARRLFLFSWKTFFSTFLTLTLIAALWESKTFDLRAGLFPWIIGFPLLALVTIQLIIDLLSKKDASGEQHLQQESSKIPPHTANRRTLQMFGWLLSFFVGIWLLGFSIGGALCVFIQLKFGSHEKWPITIILTAFAWGLSYGVFDLLLHVPFPAGQLLAWLQLAT